MLDEFGFPRKEICQTCGGSGRTVIGGEKECPECGGTGSSGDPDVCWNCDGTALMVGIARELRLEGPFVSNHSGSFSFGPRSKRPKLSTGGQFLLLV